MNDVPLIFYESLCLLHKVVIPDCLQLSGRFGEVAADVFDNAAVHVVRLSNGQFCDDGYVNQFKGASGELQKFSRMCYWYTSIAVSADCDKYSIDPAALKALSAATTGKRVALFLNCSKTREEIENWIRSIPYCFSLLVNANVPKLPETLIQKRTLWRVEFRGDDQISDEAVTQVLQLIRQDQFYQATISAFSESNLKNLVAAWRENASEMAGKIIWFKERVTLDRDLGFRTCTVEAGRRFDVACAKFRGLWTNTGSLFVKNEAGCGLYCFPLPNNALLSHKLLFVFV